MSVAGLDIGDQSSCIAVARKRGIDVLMNKESKRETPSVVAFNAKQRLIGTDAVGALSITPRNALTQLKRLLGKKFSNPDVQRDIKTLPYEVVEGPDGGCLVNVDYMGERHGFRPEQLVAILIVDMKAIAETDGSPVTDCVLSIPAYFTETERVAMLNAAQIANVKCLRLLPDNTATALAYGIYKTDLPEDAPVHVAIVDVGFSAFQVSIVAFKKGRLQVLSHAWDRNLGGRDFDEVLFEYFADEFGKQHKIDVRSNPRASFRLRMACEKLKKVLSANAEAPINVECIMNDIDVRSSMARDLFEQLAAKVLERAKAPLQQALADAKVQIKDLAAVEVVGGSSRVPALIRILKDFFGIDPSRTLNAKECVSRGCALNCAMLSPIFRVRDFEVIDCYPFGVECIWERDGKLIDPQLVFERLSPIPSAKMLTFLREQGFEIVTQYTSDSPVPEGFDRVLARFRIGPPHSVGDSGKAKLKVKIRLNLHGLVDVESVQQIEEEEFEETQVKPAADTKDTKAAEPGAEQAKARSTEDGDQQMADAEDASAGLQADGTAPAATAGPMETEDAKTDAPTGPAAKTAAPQFEVVKKKRTKKTNLPYEGRPAGIADVQLQNLLERELQMSLADKQQEQTNEAKNALEAYVYSLRGKLGDSLTQYSREEDRANIGQQLEKMEDWLYDEGEDETRAVYADKLAGLKKLGDPIERRAIEAQMRPLAASSLTATAQRYSQWAASDDKRHAHVSAEDKHKVLEECQKAMSWLQEKQGVQQGKRPTEDPELLTADIKKKEDTLTRFAEPIATRPAPTPKKPEAKRTEPAATATPEGPSDMDTEPAAGPTAAEAKAAAEANAGSAEPIVEEPMQ